MVVKERLQRTCLCCVSRTVFQKQLVQWKFFLSFMPIILLACFHFPACMDESEISFRSKAVGGMEEMSNLQSCHEIGSGKESINMKIRGNSSELSSFMYFSFTDLVS